MRFFPTPAAICNSKGFGLPEDEIATRGQHDVAIEACFASLS